MWTRKEVKARGRERFQANYWKCVLIALLFAILTGGFFSGSGVSAGSKHNQTQQEMSASDISEVSAGLAGLIAEGDATADPEALAGSFNEVITHSQNAMRSPGAKAVAGFMFIVLGFFALCITAIAILVDALVWNPLKLGCDRFFLRNLEGPAEVSNVGFGFDCGSYKNVAKILFFKDLYTVLWGLLFIIPGIVKAYEYRMIPYLLSEDPAMTKEEAFLRSKDMMKGQKWNAFVLDLSFIGWGILNIFTLGILGIFFVSPYKRSTNAALYEALKNQQ